MAPVPASAASAREIAEGVDHSGNDGAGLQGRDILDTRPAYLEKNIGAKQRLLPRGNFRACRTVGLVGKPRSQPRTQFDANVGAKRGEFLHRIGRNRDTRLVRQFTGDSYRDHFSVQLWVTSPCGRVGSKKGRPCEEPALHEITCTA